MGADKLWVDVCGHPLIFHTLAALSADAIADDVVVVASQPRAGDVRRLAAAAGLGAVRVVEGGRRRQDSVRAALGHMAGCDIVAIHDAARALCPAGLLRAVVEAASAHGAATAAVPLVDSVKRVDAAGVIVETLERSELVAVQTPQAFERHLIVDAHRLAVAHGWLADDDCALVERAGGIVVTVPGDPTNLKVTTPADLEVVRARVRARLDGTAPVGR
jgi:2-C-methyl-D-erythritol 4-phosphate cytidylyltransferase